MWNESRCRFYIPVDNHWKIGSRGVWLVRCVINGSSWLNQIIWFHYYPSSRMMALIRWNQCNHSPGSRRLISPIPGKTSYVSQQSIVPNNCESSSFLFLIFCLMIFLTWNHWKAINELRSNRSWILTWGSWKPLICVLVYIDMAIGVIALTRYVAPMPSSSLRLLTVTERMEVGIFCWTQRFLRWQKQLGFLNQPNLFSQSVSLNRCPLKCGCENKDMPFCPGTERWSRTLGTWMPLCSKTFCSGTERRDRTSRYRRVTRAKFKSRRRERPNTDVGDSGLVY